MNKPYVNIAGRKIGKDFSPIVIAEIGINHEGSLSKAFQMVRAAYEAGAEIVKGQTHVVEDEMTREAQAVIPSNATESIWNIIKRCSLTEKQEKKLKEYANSLDMIYLSTPFSRAAVNRLEKIDVPAYKIGSGECNNYPLIEYIASFGKPIILSTGMNNIESIKKGVKIIENAKVDYALLHCTSMYPTPYKNVRLGAIDELKRQFKNAVVGLSDHSLGNYTSFAAIALGASIIEKHFTFDKRLSGPDIPISLNPSELADLIEGSNAIYEALGGRKTILKEEGSVIKFAYASVVTIKKINKGEYFTKKNLWVKRPGTGSIKARFYDKILGMRAKQNIKEGTQLNWDMVITDEKKQTK